MSKNPTKPPGRVCFTTWNSRFTRLALSDPEASRVLENLNATPPRGFVSERLPFLLYTYVCGAPTTAQLTSTRRKGIQLAKAMRGLAGRINRFDKCKASSEFRFLLKDLEQTVAALSQRTWRPRADRSDTLPDWKRELAAAVEEANNNFSTFSFAVKIFAATPTSERRDLAQWAARYDRLPDVLSGLANILETNANTWKRCVVVPDRKIIQTRALALLYFCLSSSPGTSEYGTGSELAALLRPAYEAAGSLREDLTHQTVIQRIRRFRERHPEEASFLSEAVGDGVQSWDDLTANLLMRHSFLPHRCVRIASLSF